MLSRVGRPAHLPAALSAPVAAGAPVPAVVSPSLAGDARLSVGLDGRPRPVRVAGTVDVLPGLSRPDFVVLPLAAFGFTDRASVLFVAGARADPSAVRAAARAVPGAQADDLEGPGPPGGPDVLVRSAQRRALDRSAWGDGITLAFTLAVVAALVAVLLAVALARAVDAPARAGALWLLHTLGLNRGQARRLLLAESAPLLLTALLAGTALGVLLPPLLSPALGLDAFAAGVPPAVGLDAGATGLLAVAVLLTATPARTG